MSKLSRFYIVAMLAAFGLSACSGDDNTNENLGVLTPEEEVFGKANDVFSADEWYPGGELGTTEKPSYSAPAPAMDAVAGMEQDFLVGETFFEKLYTIDQAPRRGLGPAWVRNSCIACHPSYGHGKRQTEYRANTVGNGYLLVELVESELSAGLFSIVTQRPDVTCIDECRTIELPEQERAIL